MYYRAAIPEPTPRRDVFSHRERDIVPAGIGQTGGTGLTMM